MSKSLSQYVNYTIGQYLFNNNKVEEGLSKYYNNIYNSIMKKRNNKVNKLTKNEKILCEKALDKLIELSYLSKKIIVNKTDVSCHYRKFGVPFDKLVYQNKLF